jgi:anti-sigma factor RsiW
MNSNNETQCYFVQLHIDNYLDGDLTATQQESFISHVQQCSECASEFRYAKTIQDGLVDLPLIDCADSVVESLLTTVQSQPQEQPDRQKAAGSSGLADFWQWLLNAPLLVRYGVPAMAVAALAIGLLPSSPVAPEQAQPPLLANSPAILNATPVEYSPEEVAQALQDLNLAIQYLNQVSERTENMIGGRFLMAPLQENLNASFERIRERDANPLNNDPI